MFRVIDDKIIEDPAGNLTPVAYRDGCPTHFMDKKKEGKEILRATEGFGQVRKTATSVAEWNGCMHDPAALLNEPCPKCCPTLAREKVITGIGGAPLRASILPDGAKERKEYPIATGFLDYFPDATAAVANVSYRGGQQHHPTAPLHWDRAKSGDEDDTLLRHFLQRGTLDTDGIRHSAKLAWRAMALLQKEIEAEAR